MSMLINVNITASHRVPHEAAAMAAITNSTSSAVAAALRQMKLTSNTEDFAPKRGREGAAKVMDYSTRTEPAMRSSSTGRLSRINSDDWSPVVPLRRMSALPNAAPKNKRPMRRPRSSNDLVGMVIRARQDIVDDDASKISMGGVSQQQQSQLRRNRSASDLLSLMPMGKTPSRRSLISDLTPRSCTKSEDETPPRKTRHHPTSAHSSHASDDDNTLVSDDNGSGVLKNSRGKRRRDRNVARSRPMRRSQSANSDLKSAATAPTSTRSASLSRNIVPRSTKSLVSVYTPPARPQRWSGQKDANEGQHRRRNSASDCLMETKHLNFMDSSASDLFGARDRPSCQPRRTSSPSPKNRTGGGRDNHRFCHSERQQRSHSSGPSFSTLQRKSHPVLQNPDHSKASSSVTSTTYYVDHFAEDKVDDDDDDDDLDHDDNDDASVSSSLGDDDDDEKLSQEIAKLLGSSHSKLLDLVGSSTPPPPSAAGGGQKPWQCACGEENDADCNFCGMCARSQKWTCTKCYFANNKCRAIFCGGCAAQK